MRNHPLPDEAANLVVADPADPAAGNNFNYTLPDNYWYRLTFLSYTLATDANVANRYPELNYTNGGVSMLRVGTPILLPASGTYSIFWLIQNQYVAEAAIFRWFLNLPAHAFINGGAILSSDIRNIQAGDQISSIHLVFQRWPLRTV